MKFSDLNIDQFIDSIKDEVLKILRREKLPKCWYATVVSSDINGAIVKLAGHQSSLTNSILNVYNLTLSQNDKVVLFSPTGNLSNCVVLFKF